MNHSLKIEQRYLCRILQGKKTFEIRKNDRDFQVGDMIDFLPLEEKDGNYSMYKEFAAPLPMFEILYIHFGLGMQDNYVALAIEQKQA